MDFIGRLRKWIPATRAYSHRQVDQRLARYAAQVYALTWRPVDEATHNRALETILAGGDAT